MPIHILEPTVAAQIAAGEVVERPASVARELIENALDAGAGRISVEVRGGGLREIRVQDDGAGIPATQIELAFARHATSKLSSADDLWSIGTLGFRGEALPSIASVAQVVAISRVAGEDLGVELRIAGGELQSRTPTGCPVGTSISVRNLFYNTPVRREFLRSEAGEAAAVAATINQYALAYPEVRFSLLLDGRLALQTSGDGDLRAVAIEIYGLDIARQLLPVDLSQGVDRGAMIVRGLVSPPGVTRASRGGLNLFVNRRVVQPRGPLAIVVEEAYHTLLMKGRHPLVVLNVLVHPAAVDVNIHPTKSEVKFRDAPQVLGSVGRAVRDALLAGGVPLWEAGEPAPADVAQRRFELRQFGWGGDLRGSAPLDVGVRDVGTDESAGEPAAWVDRAGQVGLPLSAVSAAGPFAGLRVLGQAGQAYLVADSPEGLVLIDQHAAHERVVYERLLALASAGPVESQQLLTPLTIEIAPESHTLLLRHAHALAGWGFAIEDFGMALRVRALPPGLPVERAAAALAALAAAIEQSGAVEESPAWREALLVTLACHTAVRAGQVLAPEEIHALVDALGRCASPLTCPHGRPTMVLVGRGLIERQFGRS